MLTLGLSAEGLMTSGEAEVCSEGHVEQIAAFTAESAHADVRNADPQSDDHSPMSHPCHIGHCPFVLLVKEHAVTRLSDLSETAYYSVKNLYLSPPTSDLLRPPSRLAA